MSEFNPNPNPMQAMDSFLASCREIVDRRVRSLGLPIRDLDTDHQQTLVDEINPHAEFELDTNGLKGMRTTITGHGAMLISTLKGDVLGGEVVSDGDVVEGMIDTISLHPVPVFKATLGKIGDEGIPFDDRSLDAVLILQDALYKTGLNNDGTFVAEHSLGSQYQVGLPMLYHRLRVTDIQPSSET